MSSFGLSCASRHSKQLRRWPTLAEHAKCTSQNAWRTSWLRAARASDLQVALALDRSALFGTAAAAEGFKNIVGLNRLRSVETPSSSHQLPYRSPDEVPSRKISSKSAAGRKLCLGISSWGLVLPDGM